MVIVVLLAVALFTLRNFGRRILVALRFLPARIIEFYDRFEQGLAASPREPLLLYNLACYHSLAGRVPAAIEHLTKAISLDDRYRDLTTAEPDFDPIRQDPRFVAVTHVTV